MSQLRIADLNFCESALPTNSEVRGGLGVTVYSPTGAYSTSADSAHSSGYFTGFYFDRSTGSAGYVVSAGYSAGVAAALAGAIADGPTYASTYTGAGTF